MTSLALVKGGSMQQRNGCCMREPKSHWKMISAFLFSGNVKSVPVSTTGTCLTIATTVHMETTIPAANIRPDILIQKDERPIALVEIVHTHPPEAHVFEWAKTHKCPIVVIEVAAEDDLDHRILAPTLNPTITGGVCQCEMCERCGEGRSCNKGHWVRCQVCNEQHKFRCGLQPHRFG